MSDIHAIACKALWRQVPNRDMRCPRGKNARKRFGDETRGRKAAFIARYSLRAAFSGAFSEPLPEALPVSST